jgi:tetratricopeptide (TPR) repeat protein
MAELRMEFNSSGAVLAIASQVLEGQIAAGQGKPQEAVEHLREAARLEDALTYGEPPEWTVPVRQELGNVLLDAGQNEAAEQIFREDLRRFPDNGWSLHGLARSLQAQQRTEEAGEVRQRLERIWSGADVSLAASGR